MIIEQLNLANFRGFEQIELKFEKDVNVIAGVNGVGKSGILVALATLFSRVLPEFTASTAKPIYFTTEDILLGKTSLEASAIFTVSKHQCHMGIHRVSGDSETGDRWNSFWQASQQGEAAAKTLSFREVLESRTLTGDLQAGKVETERMLHAYKAISTQPQVIYFSPKRQLPGSPKTLPQRKPFEIANAYGFALHDRQVELREFMHWFRVVESGQSLGYAQGPHVLDKLRSVVSEFVPEFTALRIEETPSLRFVVEKNGIPLALNQLSDGERGLLAMIFDITRRLSIANPELNDPITDGKAIVIILNTAVGFRYPVDVSSL